MSAERLTNSFSTTLAAAITGTGTGSLTAAVAPPAALQTGRFRVKIDDEIIVCTGTTTTWTMVERGAEGTTAATHSNGATVYHRATAGNLAASIAPGFRMGGLPGRWYTGHQSVNSANMKGVNSAHAMPFMVARDCTLDRVGFYCDGTDGTVGQQIVWSLYEDAGGMPGKLVTWLGFWTSGASAPVAGTVYTITTSQAVKAGKLYWLVTVPKTDKFSIRGAGSGSYNPMIPINSANPTIAAGFFTASSIASWTTGGGAPDPAPTDWDSTDANYSIMLRFAA
jgi:hypothetical protein